VWRRSILIVCGVKASRSVGAAGALGAGEEAERRRAATAVAPKAKRELVLMGDLGGIVADGTILGG
jgi:hypothetical protein